MNGMLSRAPANLPPLVTSQAFASASSADSNKRFCKAWPSSARTDLLFEPTSVLDIRSPSPSSTLSSSFGGSCEGGLGSIESGAVAVSGVFCEAVSDGQLPDCTSLLDTNGGSVWEVARSNGREGGVEDIAMQVDDVSRWQGGTEMGGEPSRTWEKISHGEDAGVVVVGAQKNVEGPSSSGMNGGGGGGGGSSTEMIVGNVGVGFGSNSSSNSSRSNSVRSSSTSVQGSKQGQWGEEGGFERRENSQVVEGLKFAGATTSIGGGKSCRLVPAGQEMMGGSSSNEGKAKDVMKKVEEGRQQQQQQQQQQMEACVISFYQQEAAAAAAASLGGGGGGGGAGGRASKIDHGNFFGEVVVPLHIRSNNSSSKEGGVKVGEHHRPDEWLADLQALPGNEFQVGDAGGGGGGDQKVVAAALGSMEDLESMLLESPAGAAPDSLMKWLLGESGDDPLLHYSNAHNHHHSLEAAHHRPRGDDDHLNNVLPQLKESNSSSSNGGGRRQLDLHEAMEAHQLANALLSDSFSSSFGGGASQDCFMAPRPPPLPSSSSSSCLPNNLSHHSFLSPSSSPTFPPPPAASFPPIPAFSRSSSFPLPSLPSNVTVSHSSLPHLDSSLAAFHYGVAQQHQQQQQQQPQQQPPSLIPSDSEFWQFQSRPPKYHSPSFSSDQCPPFVDTKIFHPESKGPAPLPQYPSSPLLSNIYNAPAFSISQEKHLAPHLPFQASSSSSEQLQRFPLPSVPFAYPKQEFALQKGFHHPPDGEFLQKPMQWQLKSEPGWQAMQKSSEDPFPRLKQDFIMKSPQSQDRLFPLERRHIQLPELQRLSQWAQRGKAGSDEVQQTLGQLLKVAEAVELGNTGMAQAILARLNQHLSPKGKPLQRAAFHFKEALAKRVAGSGSSFQQPSNSPLEIINKITAYKSFCEFSPLPQFAHFTANQAILEAMEGEERVHLIDFELGLGGQWASFLQEIAMRPGGPPELLRITTIGCDSLEMQLTRENLHQFARDLSISLEFHAIPVARFDCLLASMFQVSEREAVAVNFAFGLNRLFADFSSTDSLTAFLQLVKNFSPKVVTVVDNESECDGSSQFLDSLHFYASLFESLESSNQAMETILKIEELLFAPKIASVVNGRRRTEKLPHWRNQLRVAGFSPFPFSNVAETQAGYLIRSPISRGFRFDKNQGSLLLGWKDRTLVSASAWGC